MVKIKKIILKSILFIASILVIGVGIFIIWVSTISIPDFRSFEEIKVTSSTKIYDRTGKIPLYDIHREIKRTIIPFSEMGINIKNATVAVEDKEFYQHKGIRPTSIIRAIWANIRNREFSQGGSTITQQIIKNTLLTTEKTISRKLKEWVLSLKIEQVMSKEEILAIYLNDAPYGGNVYGIQQASETFFNKKPIDLTLVEASYLAAIPKAPTFYSPYGENKDQLDKRKDLVLQRMLELNFINEEIYNKTKNEKIVFLTEKPLGIEAPHFVFFIKQYLEEKYGKDIVESGGLKVITTLDYALQKKAEEIVLRNALENEKNFNASNSASVVIDPKTGQILVMIGSRDYFDKEIDGKFNVATAKRQPGSAFKPFVYATAFKKDYTPDSVVFDLRTEFFVGCNQNGNAFPGYSQEDCYRPQNYDNEYLGPVNLRTALAESRNVPSVKLLYLVGINDSIKTAQEMGIKTLTDPSRYGLTLVLGGGEVKLLELVSAYGVFATNGIYHSPQSILRVENAQGEVLEEYQDKSSVVLDKNVASLISDVLSDNKARTPLFGSRSFLYFEDQDVAGKTGTTDNKRDGWLIGYSPSVVVGVWSGNNDNSPMEKGSSISGPMWREIMNEALKNYPKERFDTPLIKNDPLTIKPIIRGFWQGGESFFIDKVSGKLATEHTPKELIEEKIITNVHSVLYWINRKDPLGPAPENPSDDSQFNRWENTVQDWWEKNKNNYKIINTVPTEYDDVHTPESKPIIHLIEPNPSKTYNLNDKISLSFTNTSRYPLDKIDVFVNNTYLGSDKKLPLNFSFIPSEITNIKPINELKLVIYDAVLNSTQIITSFNVNL